MCLDATGAGTANGTLIETWTCNGGPNQKFLTRANGSLYNPVSGRCIDLSHMNTTPGIQLFLWDCNGGDGQRWAIPTLATAPLPLPTLDAAP
ncbi:ricin-type beta-trefoil lectin domain protein [Streptomyces sp. AP-93]|nr:ricin-type beta-trefoil lectin domain protein [Streptomyces sp. AP-93]